MPRQRVPDAPRNATAGRETARRPKTVQQGDLVSVDVLRGRQSEADFQAAVIELAQKLGYWVYHPHRSDHSESGWPDLVMLRDDLALFVELKRDGRPLPDDQAAVLAALGVVQRVWVDCWRPAQWDHLAEILETGDPWRLTHGGGGHRVKKRSVDHA